MTSMAPIDPTQPELRTDFLGRTVVLTPARANRPLELARAPWVETGPHPDCYFCPGNEARTPPEIERIDAQGRPAQPEGAGGAGGRDAGGGRSGGWMARVFPNAFPAFDKRSMSAYGLHEVLVETPEHGRALSQLDEAGFIRYLTLLARRVRAHANDRKLKYSAIFKNEGAAAGASIAHSHTQLVAMPIVPAGIKREKKLCASICPFCLLSIDDRFHQIVSDGPFLALAPYAPRFNHEVWVLPRAHTASLADLDEPAIVALGRTLRAVLRAQDASLDYPAYNLLFHLAPLREKGFHFRIEVCPRIGNWAGFEYGSGIVMNSVRPEQTAALYRDWLRAHP